MIKDQNGLSDMTKKSSIWFLRVVRQHDLYFVEILCATMLSVWGLWLFLPMNSFASSSVFLLMSGVMGEYIWGLLYLTLGILQIYAAVKVVKNLRRLSSFLAMFSFTFIGIFAMLANALSTAWVMYIVLAVWEAVVFLGVYDE